MFKEQFACNSRTSKSIMEAVPNRAAQFLLHVDRNIQFFTDNSRHST